MIGDRPLIDSAAWAQLCSVNHTEPGLDRRLLLANAYLFELIAGGDPSTWSRCRILKGQESWIQYREFCVRLDISSVQQLRAHARAWLRQAGVDEPLEWAPPLSCNATGTQLGQAAGEFPAAVAHTLLEQGSSLGQTASALGMGLEHLRLAMLDHPRPDPTSTVRPFKRVGGRKPRVAELGREYLARELESGVTLTELASRTGHSRHLITQVLREHRLPVPDCGSKATPIDARWLEREYWDNRRTLPDIAKELGMSPANLARRAKDAGIPLRERGGGSHGLPLDGTDLATIPRPLRDALTGPTARQRLERFMTLTCHDSMTDAARSMGITQSSVFTTQLAKLEADTGLELLRRHPRGTGGHQKLTPAGQLLVKQYKSWLKQHPQY